MPPYSLPLFHSPTDVKLFSTYKEMIAPSPPAKLIASEVDNQKPETKSWLYACNIATTGNAIAAVQNRKQKVNTLILLGAKKRQLAAKIAGSPIRGGPNNTTIKMAVAASHPRTVNLTIIVYRPAAASCCAASSTLYAIGKLSSTTRVKPTRLPR